MGKKSILFHRDFRGFTGGHLKVWEYYQHVLSSNNYKAGIFFTVDSSWANNPWGVLKDQCFEEWEPEKTDILFLAGTDWLALPEIQRKLPPAPVINFIQSVRHADKTNALYQFLKYPAIRICVSQQVAEAIERTDQVNGSIFVNTNGINHKLLPDAFVNESKDIPLLIVGTKNLELAKRLSDELSGKEIKHTTLLKQVSRNKFLSLINKAQITVFLPMATEGFYLPAIEAMYLGSFVICPDCIGNRSFCLDKKTCLRPSYDFKQILKAIFYALAMSGEQKEGIMLMAKKVSLNHTIQRERDNFLRLLSYI